MSQVSSNHPPELEHLSTTPSTHPDKLARPIWTEIAVVGLVVMFAAVAGGLLFIEHLGHNPVTHSLILM